MSEEWKFVPIKKKSKQIFNSNSKSKTKSKALPHQSKFGLDSSFCDEASLLSSVRSQAAILMDSQFLEKIQQSLVSEKRSIQYVVALGIGSFSSSATASLQLALLICLETLLCHVLPRRPSPHSSHEANVTASGSVGMEREGTEVCNEREVGYDLSRRVQIFEPMFSSSEIRVCGALGFHVMTDNRKGFCPCPHPSPCPLSSVADASALAASKCVSERCEGDCSTLFFLPHCPYGLYSSLLWTNWLQLQNTLILGNRCFSLSLFFLSLTFFILLLSFSSYELRRMGVEEGADCVAKVRSVVTEQPLPSSSSSSDRSGGWSAASRVERRACHGSIHESLPHFENAFVDTR